MSSVNTHAVGHFGESAACDYLVSLGYAIVQRNYRCEYGELDIIAEDERYIIFVEVKLRTANAVQSRYGRPSLAVNAQKRRHIINSVHCYLKQNRPTKCPRIDVIEILRHGAQLEIKHIKAAFGDG